MLESMRLRSRRMRSGMIGFSSRDSSARNAPSIATTIPKRPSVCSEVQPWSAAVTIVYARSITAPVTSSDPPTSTPPRSPIPRSRETSTQAATKANRPIGRFTAKIQCQSSTCVSAPPSRRPTDPPLSETIM